METESLGRTIRHMLLKGSEYIQSSTWEYNSTSSLLSAILSNKRILISCIIGGLLCTVPVVIVVLRKRQFTQKDTLCLFVYLVVSIFLLESVQKMIKLDVQLDSTYSELLIDIPKSQITIGSGPKKAAWCTPEIDRQLEEKEENMRMGEKAANAYRRLLRTTMQKKNKLSAGTILLDKLTGQKVAETDSNGNITTTERKPLYNPVKTEYCIFNERQENCPRCLFLEKNEFAEAKTQLVYIDKVNKEYQALRDSLTGQKIEFNNLSVSLIKGFKEFLKQTLFVKDELETIGVNTARMEDKVLKIVQSYNEIFEPLIYDTNTRITSTNNSVCVTIKDQMNTTPSYSSDIPQITKESIAIVQEDTHSPVVTHRITTREKRSTSPTYISKSIQTLVPLKSTILSGLRMSTKAISTERATKESVLRKGELNPFFVSMYAALTASEIFLFVQVFLVLAVIISVLFEKKRLYIGLYLGISISLVISFILGLYAFSFATGLSSLCRRGLKCGSQIEKQDTPKDIGDLIDLPQKVLKESIDRSSAQIKRQLELLLKTNATKEAQLLETEVNRLIQIRKHFPVLISENVHKTVINETEIFNLATGLKQTLNKLNQLDHRIRKGNWVETYKDLSQISMLLSNSAPATRKKKREILAQLSGSKSPVDTSTCPGKEQAICELKDRYDSLFTGLILFSLSIPAIIAV
ncbi:hypothetical protein NEOKW01_1587 [Nematocida sp. AWRm80]|nr:hypothetical protein NEOKW01_1587 [Nematocida sp. AWRm80]